MPYIFGMSTNKRDVIINRITAAALDLLRRDGFPALTQPRVAKAAGLRQSHITYYFPTRSDLVAAVAESVAARLTQGFAKALAPGGSRDMAGRLGGIGTPEQTRLLLALVLAADSEKAVRALFRRLTKDLRRQIADGVARQGVAADAEDVALIHALGVGLAVLDLARGEPASRREARGIMALALAPLANAKGKRR